MTRATRNYALVTAGYWAFTLTDGALRMLVLLHFHDLGWSPVSIAFLFLAYEFMGIVTNLVGGWASSRTGLNRTLFVGLTLQVAVLATLTRLDTGWAEWASVLFVMGLQALSGVAKDLTKTSSKTAVKFVAGDGALFRLVALLTGSKNALKGVGFFVGAALLAQWGYNGALWAMAAVLGVVGVAVGVLLRDDIGRASRKVPLRSALSKSSAINGLAAARLFLFASRDVWFVVALPVFLSDELGWSFQETGAFLALWVIGYGLVQAFAPRLIANDGTEPHAARRWVVALTAVAVAIAALVSADVAVSAVIVVGLFVFGAVFAVNSSLHSYLILAYSTSDDDVATDVGFYYSANAAGRFAGTLASGVLAVVGGLTAALWGAVVALMICAVLTTQLESVPHAATDQPLQPSR